MESNRYHLPAQAKLTESKSTYQQKIDSGFFDKYLGGSLILDVGFKGSRADADPILPSAIGVDLDYPGYDGKTLPFGDATVDTVYSSHCLEHIADYVSTLRDWLRVVKNGGHIVIVVPHMYLYERKSHPPSQWNGDHKRFYSPSRLLRELEETFPFDRYRVVHLSENWNRNFDYSSDLGQHAQSPYEIEVVIEKLK
jgi:SAM-dependent methyltransferase